MVKNKKISFDFEQELKKDWKVKQVKLTSKQLLEVFPEAKAIIIEKLAEWKVNRGKAKKKIKKLILAQAKFKFDSATWWMFELKKQLLGVELVQIDKHLERLNRLKMASEPISKSNGWSEADLIRARQTPLEQLYSGTLKQSSQNRLVGLCPFHEEKTPSFVIYVEQNSWHCFGCQSTGQGAIDFLMKQDGLNFKQAVTQLIGDIK